MADRLAEIADGLYGVPPAAFVAERAARAKGISDDPSLAARVKTLRKPAPAAWVVNVLARARREELERLLDLGGELRAAQEARDRGEITRLVTMRRSLVAALAREGALLAAEAGQKAAPAVVDAVAATLDAGLADPAAAEAIRSGRLLRALESIGFEPVDLAESVAVPEAGSPAARKRTPDRPRAIADSDAELRRARARGRADAILTRAEKDAVDAAEAFGDLEVRLRDARRALATAEREAEALERSRDTAGRAHEKARAALDAARARRRDLG